MPISEKTAFLDATAQAALVSSGDISADELLGASIDGAEKLNPELNFLVTRMYDQAKAAIKAGLPEGPFKGVPFVLKDLGPQYKGVPTSGGSKLLANIESEFDSALCKKYKQAGLVIFAKTITPEFGFQPTTEPSLHGRCKNPWDPTRTTGGSSGGSGAAVASGVVSMGHGNDGGGSIRVPASACGLFGLKPTRARISQAPMQGDSRSGLSNDHALTRSVRDSAALLDATEGAVPGDPYAAPHKERPFLNEVTTPPGKLRIAYTMSTASGKPIHDDCVKATLDTIELCKELGHEVIEAWPSYDKTDMARSFVTMWECGARFGITAAAALHGREPRAEDVEPLSWALYQRGADITGAQYLAAVNHIQRVSRDIANFMNDYDILLTPTLGEPPVPLGTFDAKPNNPVYGYYRAGKFAPFTATFNMTGQPAMSVPLFWNSEGLPIGSHFVGRLGDEATLLRLAGQLEIARPWIDRRPPVNVLV